jgi:integral membrane protein (TIGR01906 family)
MLLTASIAWAANSLWLYKYSFSEYGVSAATGIPEEQLEEAARELISYFRSGDEYVEIVVEKDGRSFDLFTREEIIHMKDVKGLFRLDYLVLLVTLVYLIGYRVICFLRYGREYIRQLARDAVRGSGITLAVLLLLWIGMLLDFDWLFLQFHLLSFTNEFWSAEGYMVMLFPSGFWYDAALFCVVFMAGAAAIIGAGAGGYLLFSRRSLQFKERIS